MREMLNSSTFLMIITFEAGNTHCVYFYSMKSKIFRSGKELERLSQLRGPPINSRMFMTTNKTRLMAGKAMNAACEFQSTLTCSPN